MTQDDWSPDEPLGTETFEQGDEAQDEASRINPDYVEELEGDPSLEPTLQIDERELEEAGVELDDPEALVSLDGGIDDPDGVDEPRRSSSRQVDDEEGWDLDEALTKEDATEGDEQDES
jgi:hypothetical protein